MNGVWKALRVVDGVHRAPPDHARERLGRVIPPGSLAWAALSATRASTIHAFGSHSSKDRELVEREILALLKRNGVKTWYAKAGIDTTMRWERTILQGLESSDWTLLVMSPPAAASGR